jgi:hypothetical protein
MKKIDLERMSRVTAGCGGGGGGGRRRWDDDDWGWGPPPCNQSGDGDSSMMKWLLPFLFTMMKDQSGGRRR